VVSEMRPGSEPSVVAGPVLATGRSAGRPRRVVRHRVSVMAVAIVAALGVLTGCAAGQQAQTAHETPSIDGVNADSGLLGIRAAGIAAPEIAAIHPAGSSVDLQLVIVNNGEATDTLTQVSSPGAGPALIGLNGPVGTGQASPTGSASAGPSATVSGSASATPSASASSPTASPTSSTGTSEQVPIPPRGLVQVGYSVTGATITLTKLAAPIGPSQILPVTFTFASGTTITADLPVKLTSSPAPAPTVNVSPTSEG
jgi:copper(I)-binding protein